MSKVTTNDIKKGLVYMDETGIYEVTHVYPDLITESKEVLFDDDGNDIGLSNDTRILLRFELLGKEVILYSSEE